MKSLNLGAISGVRIRVHWTFSLLIAWILFASLASGQTWVGAVYQLAFILVLFGCVLLHELGHALAARRYNINTRDITLLPIGGVARLERMPRDPRQELVVALAGPAVNLVIASALFVPLYFSGSLNGLVENTTTFAATDFLTRLMLVNVALVVFNLVPAFPMDGGRVLRAVAGLFTDYRQATRLAATIGQGFALLFAVLGLFNPLLFFIAAFVFFGAAAEAKQVETESQFGDAVVGDGMLKRFQVIHPDANLREVAESLLDGPQRDYPVVQDGRFLGMLRRSQIISSLGSAEATVSDAMEKGVTLSEDDLVLSVLRGSVTPNDPLPVTREGILVGLLDLTQLSELLESRSQLRRSRHTQPSFDVSSLAAPSSRIG